MRGRLRHGHGRGIGRFLELLLQFCEDLFFV